MANMLTFTSLILRMTLPPNPPPPPPPPPPPQWLHHISAGLQRHLRENGKQIDLFSGPDLSPFKATTLDGEMKRLQSKGLGSIKKQAEVITEEGGDLLWQTGQLGDSNLQQLLDTIVFYCVLHFSIRSGKEHRQLRNTPCHIQLVESPGQDPYLVYREDVSKNHPGGLQGRNMRSGRAIVVSKAFAATKGRRTSRDAPCPTSLTEDCPNRPRFSEIHQRSLRPTANRSRSSTYHSRTIRGNLLPNTPVYIQLHQVAIYPTPSAHAPKIESGRADSRVCSTPNQIAQFKLPSSK